MRECSVLFGSSFAGTEDFREYNLDFDAGSSGFHRSCQAHWLRPGGHFDDSRVHTLGNVGRAILEHCDYYQRQENQGINSDVEAKIDEAMDRYAKYPRESSQAYGSGIGIRRSQAGPDIPYESC